MCKETRKEIRSVSLPVVIFLLVDLILQSTFRSVGFGVENRGVSFGLAQNIGGYVSIIVFGLVFGCFVYERLRFKKGRLSLLFLGLGGAGNVVCRLIWGSVWDYICLPFLPFCFNLSDVLICLGVASYILGVDGNRDNLRGQRNISNQ